MGLFSNNKKPCPICGEATPRLLATQIADKTPLCSNCARKLSMTESQVRALSVEALKEHLTKREENAAYLESTFRPTKKLPIGWTSINIDETNRVFTIPLNMCGDTANPPAFPFAELSGFELLEDGHVIERFFRGDAAPEFTPTVHIPVIHIHYDDKDEKDNKPETISRSFQLNLYLTNPCWDKVESGAGSVVAGELRFQQEYNRHVSELRRVTAALAGIIGTGTAAGAAKTDADSVAGELMKFKQLMDGGILTQEEFNAKKKQLLGI